MGTEARPFGLLEKKVLGGGWTFQRVAGPIPFSLHLVLCGQPKMAQNVLPHIADLPWRMWYRLTTRPELLIFLLNSVIKGTEHARWLIMDIRESAVLTRRISVQKLNGLF